MRTIHVLLGNCEALLNNYIEALLTDVYGQRAVLKFTRTAWLEEFHQQSSTRKFDLLLLIPNNLRLEDSQSGALDCGTEVLRVVRSLKSRHSSPILALAVADQRAHDEPLLVEAGVDCVLGLPFQAETMKSAVRRLLRVPAACRQSPARRPWLSSWSPFAAVANPLASQ